MTTRVCVDETCTIHPALNPVTGALVLDVPIDALGGIDCDPDDGLHVRRLGGSAPVAPSTVQNCAQRIGVTTDNQLFVETHPHRVFNQAAGATIAFTSNDTDHESFSAVFTNPFANCAVWVRFVAAQPQLVTRINTATAVESPGGSGRFRCYRQGFAYLNSTVPDVNGQNRVTTRSDLLLRVAGGEDDLQLQKNDMLQMLVPLAGGQSTTFSVGIRHSVQQGFRTTPSNGGSFTAQRMHIEVFRRFPH